MKIISNWFESPSKAVHFIYSTWQYSTLTNILGLE